jgi:hypothetical protein
MMSRQLDTGKNDRFFRDADESESFVERRRDYLWIRFLLGRSGDAAQWNFEIYHVVRHLNVNRPLVPHAGFNATYNFASSALLIEENRARNGYFVVNSALRFESFDLVMQKRVVHTILSTGSAAYHHHRRFLGIGAGNGIQNIQPPTQ